MITDWRWMDNTPQMNGDEVDGYTGEGGRWRCRQIDLPCSAVEDLLMVEGMTPRDLRPGPTT